MVIVQHAAAQTPRQAKPAPVRAYISSCVGKIRACLETLLSRLEQAGLMRRVDETYVKIRGSEVCVYRAVDWAGRTVDCRLSARRCCHGKGVPREGDQKLGTCSRNHFAWRLSQRPIARRER
jgi:hypothetical protein